MAKWFHQIGPQQYEALDYQALQKRWYEGCLRPNDLVWTEGMPSWQPAKSIPNLMPGTYIHQPTRWDYKEQTAIEKHDGAFVLAFGLLSWACLLACIGILVFAVLVSGRPATFKSFYFGASIAQTVLILLCPIFGIEAISMGHTDLKKMQSGKMDVAGREMTRAGYILGIVLTCLYFLLVVVSIAMFVMAAVSKQGGTFH